MGNSTNLHSWPALPWLIGHRGAAGLAPENTLPSFEKAFRQGVSAVELDVYRVEDRLMVFHDDELQRTTNGQGQIEAQSLAYLRNLDAGEGAQIPFLEEVLGILPAGIALNIELKGRGTAEPVHKLLRQYPALKALISSFSAPELRRYRALDATATLGVLRHRWPPAPWQQARQVAPWSINLNQAIASEKRIKKVKAAGYRCFAYTVNDIGRGRALLQMGIDGLFTDRPDLLGPLFE